MTRGIFLDELYDRPGFSRFDIHLQWFAAEDEGRTEDATEQKIRKAREEGKVAKSPEFVSAITLLFPILTIAVLGKSMLTTCGEMLKYFFSAAIENDVTRDPQIVTVFYYYFFKLTLPVFGIAVLSALIANLLQVGFLFTTKTIVPDFKRIVPNFSRFLQKSFFSGEALFNLTKSIVKIVIIGLIAYLNIRSNLGKMIHFVHVPFMVSVSTLSVIALKIMVEAAVVMLVISLPDYMFQRHQHLESLKMTKQEVKEERKQSDGDPLIKRRLRERMQQILSQNMMENVPRADVIITNPTHYAIGIEWKRESMTAPMVIAKGQDNMAFRIRDIAREHSVPLVENKPLARALYSEVEIGDEIPEKYYEVTALVLAQVYKLSGRAEEAV
ncbi:MAG: flagellar biosynthesis protein FlhB [Spirochaetales bacterium]|nr:flagellar biosynthesis protein FlhB [Spirochaetales bacterium]